jgi:hypothetical protein
VALALINVGLAGVIVEAIGARNFLPLWVAVVLVLVGAVAAVGAFTLWRGYLQSSRDPSAADH